MSDPMGWIAAELERLEAGGLRRHPVTLSSPPGAEVVIGGRRVLQLCSNDYLGLAGDPRLRRAAREAALRWGAGTGASRLVSGTGELHRALEADLARHKGCEEAILFSSGYLANLGAIAALAGREDAVFSDELNHASIVDGCRLSRARVVVYRHADVGDLDRLLAEVPARRRLVVTDTVFSMDGDMAPLGAIAEVCDRRGAMLMVDEAHATGLLGSRGAGAVEAAGLTGRVGVVMATLSKALGSAGGFVAGSHDLVEWLRNRARSYVFDTAPPPAAVGAAIEAVRIIAKEPHRGPGVVAAAARLAQALAGLGYDVGRPAAAILPVLVGDGPGAMALSSRLFEHGVFVPA
ncbi:MAG TPA: 8-amino-7-oxononanoate synthase, partial [Actinomycetota bacterium]|nr:8-amino-7-oxononanoate synthase [Actinomycetota bacterium]